MTFFVASIINLIPHMVLSFLNLKHLTIRLAEGLRLTMPAQNNMFLYLQWISNKMQIPTCKKSTKLLNTFLSHWEFVISQNFEHTRPYPTKAT